MPTDYKTSLNLPNTKFPMKANLTQREPQFLERWEKMGLYDEILESRKASPKFILHDGPPYANGHIHLGTALNKILKDFVVKSKTMAGFRSPYLPGWDCHGLPIELQVMKDLGSKAKTLSKVELRKECRKYAEKFVKIQREEFKRLGVFGEWETPYLTMNFGYQAQIAREFGKIVEADYVYRRRRTIHWCPSCETALAEAEIEYADHSSPSIYVMYPVLKGWEEIGAPPTPAGERFAMIWTTTPWTLPASMAIAFHPEEQYVVAERSGVKGRFIVARKLLASIAADQKVEFNEVAAIGSGEKLRKIVAGHPFLEREIPFLPAAYVTMDTGTGLVHTAPGHGEEDYETGVAHGLDVYSPVGSDGRFEKDVKFFAGMHVFEANPHVIDHLRKVTHLFGEPLTISHSYPHCWRCKKPVIFRATAQWFLSLAKHDLRAKTLEEVEKVQWLPKWGRDRIHGMLEARPDWCLSRQRTWGVPLVAFECKSCGEYLLSAPAIFKAAEIFEKESADAWFARDVKDFLPAGAKCAKCGAADFEKGSDILDVWFDSGSSHAAVLEKNDHLGWPCDLYLEGSDQHRGWFHSSLLEGMATRGRSPYKTVITHGFTVDGQGRKMSKSLGNYVSAQDLVKAKGAEMVRLWVATENYRDDMRFSDEILERVVESYRRIRNTARYLLGNLGDFSPDKDAVPLDKLAREMDRWALDRYSRLVARVRKAYDDYEFHMVVSPINEFCVIELSSLYLDTGKDTLYCDAASGLRRRSAQTVAFEIGKGLATLLAPVLPVTAEEIWESLPDFKGKAKSVHLATFPEPRPLLDEAFVTRWSRLFAIRAGVSKALESLRKDGKIGQSLEAAVELAASDEDRKILESLGPELPLLFIVSRAKLVKQISTGWEAFEAAEVPGLKIGVSVIGGERCSRCWTYAEDLGSVSSHPELCGRCAGVIGGA